MDTRLEDYFLEIRTLQMLDYKNATENNFDSRTAWFNHMMSQQKDEIAEAIISLSERYEVPLSRAAEDFDPSMVLRVGRIKNLEKSSKKLWQLYYTKTLFPFYKRV